MSRWLVFIAGFLTGILDKRIVMFIDGLRPLTNAQMIIGRIIVAIIIFTIAFVVDKLIDRKLEERKYEKKYNKTHRDE